MQPTSSATPAPYRESVAMAGRLSVRYQTQGREEALHGNFSWQQDARRTEVHLLSPLGQTIARISVEPGMASLTQAGQATRTATDVDSLAESALGWPLPVSGLRDWLQGQGIASNGNRFSASPAKDTVMTSDGWKLHYVAWQDSAPGMPRRIDLERDTPHAGLVAIRIVIDDWSAR